MRTKSCRSLGRAVCTAVADILISEDEIEMNGSLLTSWEVYSLAIEDGFSSVDDFRSFFKRQYGLPFEGEVIRW